MSFDVSLAELPPLQKALFDAPFGGILFEGAYPVGIMAAAALSRSCPMAMAVHELRAMAVDVEGESCC